MHAQAAAAASTKYEMVALADVWVVGAVCGGGSVSPEAHRIEVAWGGVTGGISVDGPVVR